MKEYDKSKLYLIAVSGGPDSMALLDMLVKQDYKLIVTHVNYKTRDESDLEEELVRNYCNKHNLKCYVAYFNNEYEGNFEDAARVFRYNFFSSIYLKEKANGLFVAHHKDDVLETYLLKKRRNVINESYLIKEKSNIFKMLVIRPLIYDYYKADLIKYCNDNNISYGIDKTNFMDIHTRNIIRKEIASLDKDELYKKAIEEENTLILTRKEVKEFIKYYPVYETKLLINKSDLFLRIFIYEAIKANYRRYINKGLLISLKGFINSKKVNLSYNIHGSYYLILSYGTIIFDNVTTTKYCYKLDNLKYLKTKHFILKDSGLKMEGIYVTEADFPVLIRSYNEEDKIKLKEGNKKVSRLFIDKKTPLHKRISYPIIENKDHEIIFVYKLYRKHGYKNIKNNLYLALKD